MDPLYRIVSVRKGEVVKGEILVFLCVGQTTVGKYTMFGVYRRNYIRFRRRNYIMLHFICAKRKKYLSQMLHFRKNTIGFNWYGLSSGNGCCGDSPKSPGSILSECIEGDRTPAC